MINNVYIYCTQFTDPVLYTLKRWFKAHARLVQGPYAAGSSFLWLEMQAFDGYDDNVIRI